jgi:ferredoxin
VVDEKPPVDNETNAGKPVIDGEACMGSGNCVYWAPDVFQLDDDDGIAFVRGDLAGNEERVSLAMTNCPTSAIRLTDG